MRVAHLGFTFAAIKKIQKILKSPICKVFCKINDLAQSLKKKVTNLRFTQSNKIINLLKNSLNSIIQRQTHRKTCKTQFLKNPKK